MVGEIGPTGANGEGSTSVDPADVNLIHQQPSIATDKVRVRMRVRVMARVRVRAVAPAKAYLRQTRRL